MYATHVTEVVAAVMSKVPPWGSAWFHILDNTCAGSDDFGPNIVANQMGLRKGEWLLNPARIELAVRAHKGHYAVRPVPFEKQNPTPPSVQAILPVGESTLLWVMHTPYPFYDRASTRVPTKSTAPAGNSASKYLQPPERGTPFHSNNVWKPDKNGELPKDRMLRTGDIYFDSLRSYLEIRKREIQEIESILSSVDGFLHDDDGLPRRFCGHTTSRKTSDQTCWATSFLKCAIKGCTSEFGVCRHCGKPWVRGDTLDGKPSCRCRRGAPRRAVVLDVFSAGGTAGIEAVRLGRDYVGIEMDETLLEGAARNIGSPGIVRNASVPDGAPDLGLIGEMFGVNDGDG
jgi:hypothetical protein